VAKALDADGFENILWVEHSTYGVPSSWLIN
jgi:hypothetical protein